MGRPKGWHREDIKAAVRKRGTTLTQLAIDSGLHAATLRNAMIQPCYPGEQAIAAFLGVPAQELWPDRYDPDGTPNKQPRYRARHLRERETAGHVQKRAAG